VIYDVRASKSSRDAVTVRTDKIVKGAREFMNESDFGRAKDGSWVSEIQSPRFHLRVVFTVAGARMTGSVTEVGSGNQVRKMALQKSAAGTPKDQ
jgi:hypothetical protein